MSKTVWNNTMYTTFVKSLISSGEIFYPFPTELLCVNQNTQTLVTLFMFKLFYNCVEMPFINFLWSHYIHIIFTHLTFVKIGLSKDCQMTNSKKCWLPLDMKPLIREESTSLKICHGKRLHQWDLCHLKQAHMLNQVLCKCSFFNYLLNLEVYKRLTIKIQQNFKNKFLAIYPRILKGI